MFGLGHLHHWNYFHLFLLISFSMWLLENVKLQTWLTLYFTGQRCFRQSTSLSWAKQDATNFFKSTNNPPVHNPARGIRHWKSIIGTTGRKTPNDWRRKLALWKLKGEKWSGSLSWRSGISKDPWRTDSLLFCSCGRKIKPFWDTGGGKALRRLGVNV